MAEISRPVGSSLVPSIFLNKKSDSSKFSPLSPISPPRIPPFFTTLFLPVFFINLATGLYRIMRPFNSIGFANFSMYPK